MTDNVTTGNVSKIGRILGIVVAGNFIEWVDWGIYGFVAVILGKVFFPKTTPLVALASTFIIFGVGFLARPVGGVIWGHIGDKHGRKNALLYAFILMTLGSVLTGLSPSYAQVGDLAPFILLIFRLVQGLSVGGEFGGDISYLVENGSSATFRGRGFLSSLQQFTTLISLLVGISIAAAVSALPGGAAYTYGWRLAFILPGLFVLPVGVYFRYRMPDTPHFNTVKQKHKLEKNPVVEVVTKSWKTILLGIGMVSIATLDFYVGLTYLPSYLVSVVHMNLTFALDAVRYGIIIAAAFVWIFGIISDKIGRKIVGLIGGLWYLIFSVPVFMMVNTGNPTLVVLGVLLLNFGIAPLSGATVAWIAEVFPTVTRYIGFSFVVQVGVGTIGGFSPYVSTALIGATGNHLAPAFYVVGGAIVSMICMLILPDTAKKELADTYSGTTTTSS